MKLDYNKGAIPLYLQIKEDLRNKIESKKYNFGDLIPSELELEKKYKVSRITVRQAILDLEKEGYVKRARGKGTSVTFTTKIDENLKEIRSFTKEMEDRNKVPGTLFTDITVEKANEDVAKKLQIEVGSKVYRLYRVRSADDEAIVVFESYLPGTYDFPLEKEKYEISMYDVFEELDIHLPKRVNERFEAMLADKTLASALDVQIGSPIFKRERVAFNEENKVIEYTISFYRGDRYTYSIQLERK